MLYDGRGSAVRWEVVSRSPDPLLASIFIIMTSCGRREGVWSTCSPYRFRFSPTFRGANQYAFSMAIIKFIAIMH